MKKHNKTAPFLMILVLSMVAMQFSLKAVGINITPSMGTVVHSWGKMASMIGGVYQPGFVAELDTLSNHLLCNEKAPADAETPCGELACNKVKDFEFELPPQIDLNDPSVTIEEPVQELSPKAMTRPVNTSEEGISDMLPLEVLEITADADEEGGAVGPAAEKGEEVIRSIAVGVASDEPEAESKATPAQFENKIFFTSDEAQSTPKADKIKKPCSDLEKLKKFEEIKKLREEFQLEPEWHYLEPAIPDFTVQTFQASQNLEKSKRVRIIIKRNTMLLPLAMPRSAARESINFVDLAE
jgi:hypothetical protein